MPRSSLVLFNISKRHNLGNIIRTADALGVEDIVVVGRKQYRTLGAFGTHDTRRLRHFYTLDEALADLRGGGAEIVAIEIADDATSVVDEPFTGDTAFLLDNEGTGLTPDQLRACDRAIYIPQFGSGASLNVNVAAGIVLHRFASWAELPSRPHRDGKFIASPDQEAS